MGSVGKAGSRASGRDAAAERSLCSSLSVVVQLPCSEKTASVYQSFKPTSCAASEMYQVVGLFVEGVYSVACAEACMPVCGAPHMSSLPF